MHSFCSIVRWDKAYDFSCFTDYCTRVRQKFGLGLPSNATTVALLPYLYCDPLHRGHLAMPRSVRPSVCPSVETLKMRDIKLRDMKMRHHVAGVENARHKSAAPECKGGNARHENARNAIVWNTACCICLSIAEQECMSRQERAPDFIPRIFAILNT